MNNALALLALLALLPLSAAAAGPRQTRPADIKLVPAAGRVPARSGEVSVPAALPPAAAVTPEAAALIQPEAQATRPSEASSVVPFSPNRLASGGLERMGAAAGKGIKGEAGMNLAFDGRRDGSGGDGGGPTDGNHGVDFAQGVSQAHRALFLKAVEQHSDSFSGFFTIMGRPIPGFLWVVEAREDSPGAAAVVTRVVYEITPSSSRVSEEVQAPFWVAVDLRTGKVEFFSKDPDGLSIFKPFAQVIDNARDWQAIWSQVGESAPSVNFKTSVAVFVNEGVKSRGGYGVKIFTTKTPDGPVAMFVVDAPTGFSTTQMTRVFGYKVYPRSEAPIRVERVPLRTIPRMPTRVSIKKAPSAVPSWLELKSLYFQTSAWSKRAGGGSVTLKDGQNNLVQFLLPAPGIGDQTLKVRFSPFHMVHSVEEFAVTADNAVELRAILTEAVENKGLGGDSPALAALRGALLALIP